MSVTLDLADAAVQGDLEVPDGATGVVLFAHGSGSSRHSPRNRSVAAGLRRAGLGTLLLDLLTPEEGELDAATGTLRFDIDLLTRRLVGAVDWLACAARPPIGLFGASTGAAAALAASARRPGLVRAVVSRGGRPDLAWHELELVRAPVLLIVGGNDAQVLELNEMAGRRLAVPHRMEVVPGATHLFEEPGALERVTELAAGWFREHLLFEG
ncbi:hydrolase [Actinomadura craniellae]|uniref:Hydrolase n=1 Tax=Actinomadura craniellae TaxID=2231787 RepID=A0A365H9V5_9ACTN|nr:dienelactone hydrolase family protein [Actinomadura craniellae]RAY15920.1 hydrolase [Actinomadura craniellae]